MISYLTIKQDSSWQHQHIQNFDEVHVLQFVLNIQQICVTVPFLYYILFSYLLQRICISSNQPNPSSEYNFADAYFCLETYQEALHISDLEQGQTVGFSIADNFVHIFIDGVLSDRKELLSPVHGEVWGVVGLTGRIRRVRLSLSGKSCKIYY